MIRTSGQKKMRDNSSGVSEIIGAILLISVVVLAVAIIAAGLFSQPLPQKIPSSSFITNINGSTKILTIYHDGGDPLYRGEFFLKINDARIDDNAYTITPGGGNIWSVGKSLVLSNVSDNSKVQIFYNTGSGEVLLDQLIIQPTPTMVPDVYVPPVPICPACNISGCNQSVIGDAYTQIVTSNSSMFLRDDGGTQLSNGGFLYFKVTNTSSTLTFSTGGSPTLQTLYPGDRVKITLDSANSQNFKAFGLGNKFYFLGGDSVIIAITNATTGTINNLNNGHAVSLQNGWITGYVDIGSTLTIISNPDVNPKYDTLLVINGTTIINSENNVQTITIEKIRPIGVGLFFVQENANGNGGDNFVGYAEKITVDGVTQH